MTKVSVTPIENNSNGKGKDTAAQKLVKIFGENIDFSRPTKVSVTPKIAEDLLKLNTKNRRIRQKHVAWIAKQMELGYWLYTGDSIKVSNTGVLLDKQHTLHAVVKSGTTIEMVLVTGLDEVVFNVLDTGMARTAGDVLYMHNIPHANNLAAAIKKYLLYKADAQNFDSSQGKDYSQLISNAKILETYNSDKNEWGAIIEKALYFYKENKSIPASVWGMMYKVFSEIDVDDAHEFCSKVSFGIGLKKHSPMLVLRQKLIKDMASIKKHSLTDKVYWFLVAWNYFRKGGTITKIQTPRDKVMPELL